MRTTAKITHPIIQQGIDDHNDGMGHHLNPYDAGTSHHKLWRKGWVTARKAKMNLHAVKDKALGSFKTIAYNPSIAEKIISVLEKYYHVDSGTHPEQAMHDHLFMGDHSEQPITIRELKRLVPGLDQTTQGNHTVLTYKGHVVTFKEPFKDDVQHFIEFEHPNKGYKAHSGLSGPDIVNDHTKHHDAMQEHHNKMYRRHYDASNTNDPIMRDGHRDAAKAHFHARNKHQMAAEHHAEGFQKAFKTSEDAKTRSEQANNLSKMLKTSLD